MGLGLKLKKKSLKALAVNPQLRLLFLCFPNALRLSWKMESQENNSN